MFEPPLTARVETELRPPVPEGLLALAPLRLTNRGRTRYLGDDQCIALRDLAERDQFLVRHLYELLTELLLLISERSSDDVRRWREVLGWAERHDACRQSADRRFEMTIFPVPRTPGDRLRFVLSNAIKAEDATTLQGLQNAGGADSADKGAGLNLENLFNPQVSSTGSGFGLTVVAVFVAGAFGLRNRHEALRERYVGAVLDDGVFRVWFHWPIANSGHPPKLDDYHRPQQSLSDG